MRLRQSVTVSWARLFALLSPCTWTIEIYKLNRSSKLLLPSLICSSLAMSLCIPIVCLNPLLFAVFVFVGAARRVVLKRVVSLVFFHTFRVPGPSSLAFRLNSVLLGFKLLVIRVFLEQKQERQLPIVSDERRFHPRLELAHDLVFVQLFERFTPGVFVHVRPFDQVVAELSHFALCFTQLRWVFRNFLEVGISQYLLDRRPSLLINL